MTVYSEYVKKRIVFYYEKELGCAQIVKALRREQISVSRSGVWRFLKGYKKEKVPRERRALVDLPSFVKGLRE